VVVQDNKGAPITGLTKDNFAVFDEGKQQEIAFFSAGSNAPAPAAVPPGCRQMFSPTALT